MRYIFFILSALSLTSCMTSQKATSYLESKGELPKICADKFPVKDSIIVKDSVTLDTVYVGDVITDTVWMNALDTGVWIGGAGLLDTGSRVFNWPIGKRPVITKTLPAKVITKTQVQVKEVYRENTARVVALQTDLQTVSGKLSKAEDKAKELTAEVSQWKKKARQRWWWIVALIVFAFRRQIIGGAGRVLKHWAG